MNIIICVRTLNEEHRIGQFCTAYKDADKILMADGGSIDQTIAIAKSFPNVELHHYTKRIELKNGLWRNPDSDHANFLFGHAYSLNPDWIIFDDCDIRPNYLLRQTYREILTRANEDVVMAVRVYLWEGNQYFPAMSSPLGEEKGQPSLWAWRGNIDLWTVDAFPHFTLRIGSKKINDLRTDTKCLGLVYPYCLLHYSWADQKSLERKIKYHCESGLTPSNWHPLNFAGMLKPCEEWMKE